MENLVEQSVLASNDEIKDETAERSKGKFTSRQWRILVCLLFGQFCLSACFSLQAPFFPREAEKKGATPTQYAFVFSVFELAIIVASLIFGKMMVICTPQFLVISGEFLCGACVILFGLLQKVPAGYPFIATAYAVRIVEGIGCAAFITSSFTVVASEFPNRVATTFALIETFNGLGLITGPAIGGLLYEAGGYFAPFASMGALLLASSGISFFLLPYTVPKMNQKGNMIALISNIELLLDCLSIISSQLFIGFNAATLETHLRQFGLSPSVTGIVFMITGAMYGVSTPMWGWLCDKGFNPNVLCLVGYAIQCVNLLLLGPVFFFPFNSYLWLVIVALLMGGFGMAAKMVCSFVNALRNTILRGFPDDTVTYGMVSAVFQSSCSIGVFVGPSIGGILLQYIGFRKITAVLLTLEIIFMFLALLHYLLSKRHSVVQNIDESITSIN